MKERPIIFSCEMVRAVLDGRKTMTRRVVVPQPEYGAYPHHDEADGVAFANPGSFHKYRFLPNDHLWVRETWYCDNPSRAQDILSRGEGLYYKATEEHPGIFPKWRPSIFMPRWASRITLEITDIRVERLQHISEKDAVKEGLISDEINQITAAENFENLWDSINGKKYPWASNPWVWVIEFRRIE